MENKAEEIIEILEKYNQHHIVEHMEKQEDNIKTEIIEQVKNIDFEELLNSYNNVKTIDPKTQNRISKIEATVAHEIDEEQKNSYIKLGEEVLKLNKFSAVTLAGGQGTRLRT